jgi:purine-nucleoside phosphorylase
MIGRLPDYFGLDRYSISADDVVQMVLRCDPSVIRANVLMTPVWSHQTFLDVATLQETATPEVVYSLRYRDELITLIRSGIGAPQTGEVMLALACTPCRRVVLVGSVGGLVVGMRIGDLVIPTDSVSGDGFSKYLSKGSLAEQEILSVATPDPGLRETLQRLSERFHGQQTTAVLRGRVFCVDSIVAQFHHVEEMMEDYACIGVEMETAAVFRVAAMVGIRAAALLQISDVIPDRKSLFSGRTDAEQQRRTLLRRTLLPRIALEALMENDAAG